MRSLWPATDESRMSTSTDFCRVNIVTQISKTLFYSLSRDFFLLFFCKFYVYISRIRH